MPHPFYVEKALGSLGLPIQRTADWLLRHQNCVGVSCLIEIVSWRFITGRDFFWQYPRLIVTQLVPKAIHVCHYA